MKFTQWGMLPLVAAQTNQSITEEFMKGVIEGILNIELNSAENYLFSSETIILVLMSCSSSCGGRGGRSRRRRHRRLPTFFLLAGAPIDVPESTFVHV